MNAITQLSPNRLPITVEGEIPGNEHEDKSLHSLYFIDFTEAAGSCSCALQIRSGGLVPSQVGSIPMHFRHFISKFRNSSNIFL
jgi:hypothetical protein